MSEHISNYLGNQQSFVTASGANAVNAQIAQNLITTVSGVTTYVSIPTDLYQKGREMSITDYAGNAANGNIVVSGTDINGSTSYTLNAAYETQAFINKGSDAWVAPNTQS